MHGRRRGAEIGTILEPRRILGAAREREKAPIDRAFSNSGGGIRTRDLRVMSPTSYQTAPPRGAELHDSNSGRIRSTRAVPARAARIRRHGPRLRHPPTARDRARAPRRPSTTSRSGRATCRPRATRCSRAWPRPRGCCRCSSTGSTPSCSTPRRSCAPWPTTRSASTTSTSRRRRRAASRSATRPTSSPTPRPTSRGRSCSRSPGASSRPARTPSTGKWRTWEPQGWIGADVHGATLAVVGAGRIGQAVAQRAAGSRWRSSWSTSATTSTPRSSARTSSRSTRR